MFLRENTFHLTASPFGLHLGCALQTLSKSDHTTSGPLLFEARMRDITDPGRPQNVLTITQRNRAGERLGGGTLAMRKSNTKDKQRNTARGLHIAEHSLRASDATGNLFDNTTKKADIRLRCMNLFSCGAVNDDEKSRHEADWCAFYPPHPPAPHRGVKQQKNS